MKYSPQCRTAAGRLLLLAAYAAAFACFCFGFGPQTPKAVALNCAGIVIAGTGTLVAIRGFFTRYTYFAEESDAPGGYDLVVTAAIGKKERVVCRVSIRDMKITGSAGRGRRVYAYHPFFCGKKICYLDPPEAMGAYLVKVAASDEFIDFLILCGAEKE